MRFFPFIMISLSVSAFCAPIKDFAPDQVGNYWKYNINFSFYAYDWLPDSENFTRTIKLVKIESGQDSKNFIFDIIDSGQRYSKWGGLDSFTIQAHYSDTCLQIGDSIGDIISYSTSIEAVKDTLVHKLPNMTVGNIRFFPFFEYHGIDSADPGMTKILLKKDSLFQFSRSFYNRCNFLQYIQNIGLDSLLVSTPPNTRYFLSAKLISYTILEVNSIQPAMRFQTGAHTINTNKIKINIVNNCISATLPYTTSRSQIKIGIFNVSGKRIYMSTMQLHNGILNIPAAGFPAGKYFMSIAEGNASALTSKFILMR